ncbi:hypothetical protein TI39_contig5817g00016 [Zymoseptoria brevis]|uniref:Transmembrane protein UsgS n=1 Tax=Zymoseptoria brevis TaxID=1047168 RepID=A0A0F4G684_9PEZI|nr:hypothetical protein TI39_contig5817g00016 [Zymoseptoria brevis]
MSNYGFFGSFELNSMVRGVQLTIVGANRALQNPSIFTTSLYKQAALAVAAGILIRLLVAIPTLGIRLLIAFAGLFTDTSGLQWSEDIIDGIEFIEHSVLQIPFFLMSFMRYLSPAMDHMFMESLRWVDQTYVKKHESEDPKALREMYHPNLELYSQQAVTAQKKEPKQALVMFLTRYGRKAGISLAVYVLSFVPYVGRLVLPAASFYTFNKAVGLPPAIVVFGSSFILPKRYLVMFLQSYFSSRSLMRELLEPYFSRIHYSPEQKRAWFRDREGVLYGFAFAFFAFLKIPLVGVLIYGIAEASTAYLITKITQPPPPPQEADEFKKRDVRWENKHEFLSLPVGALDRLSERIVREKGEKEELKGRQYS